MDNWYGHWFLRIGFLLMLVFGSVATLPEVIALADLSTGLMTIVNVTALFMLSTVVITIAKDYHQQHDRGRLPTYQPNEHEQAKFNLTEGIWLKK